MFLLAIIPHTPITERILNTLCLTAGASSAGLLLTAIVQTAQHQFSLFHALFILHILYSLGIGISPMGECSAISCFFVSRSSPPPAGNYHVTGSRIAMAVLLQLVLVFSFIAWGSYLWVNVKDFGSQPECNDRIKYVILFFTVRATAPWLRFLWIAFFAFLGAQVLVSLFGSAAIFFIIKREMKREIEEWAQEVDSNEHWVRTTETQDARQHTVDNWHFHLDFSRLLCVGPLSLLTGTHESLRSYTIYVTYMLERTVSDSIIYHTCSLFTAWSRWRETRHISYQMGRTMGLVSSSSTMHGNSDKSCLS